MPGVTNRTGRAMDVALNDATVLGVQADNGDIAFTRRGDLRICLLYTSPSPRDDISSRMPSSA